MEYRTLGATGMRVSKLCLGAMNFGKGVNEDRDECVRMIHTALDAGVNFVDTADVYTEGTSEEIVGEALSGRREEVVLATKFHFPAGDDPNMRGNSRRWIMQAVDRSLRRLQTDWIDLYQVHRPAPETDIDETLSALSDLIRQGKVRAIGTSTFPAEQIVEYHWVAERRNRERFRCEQPPYSLFVRHIERDVLPVCRDYGMGVIVWSPLNSGWLTGKYRRGHDVPRDARAARQSRPDRWDWDRPGNQRKLDLVEDLLEVAADSGTSLPRLAQAWTLEHPAVTSAIVGPRTPEHLEESLAAGEVELDEDALDRIDAVVPPGTDVDQVEGMGRRAPELSRRSRRRTPVTRKKG